MQYKCPVIINIMENVTLKPSTAPSLMSGQLKPTDIIKSVKNDTVVNITANKLRRSVRLSKKRTVDEMSFNEEENQRDDLIKKRRMSVNVNSGESENASSSLDNANTMSTTSVEMSIIRNVHPISSLYNHN